MVAALLFAIFAYPYLRIFFKRLKLYRKLYRTCKKNDYTVYPTHRFWFFGRNGGKNADLYIKTSDTVYAVKLFAMRKHRGICITEGGMYYREKYLSMTGVSRLNFIFKSKEKPCPEYNFRCQMRDSFYKAEFILVLLINPVSVNIYRMNKSQRIPLTAGDVMFGGVIHSGQSFVKALNKE